MTYSRKTLAASTAMVLALGVLPAQAQQANPCNDLLERLESMPEELPESADWTIRDVEEAAASEDAQRCEVILTRVDETMRQQGGENQDQAQTQAQDGEEMTTVARERQRVTLQDEEVVEGIVRLNRQPPQVEIEEGQTEVQVTPGQSSVSVQERSAQITVREQPARITVDVPQPTIRIEQAAPEIIITMPEPGVDVTEAEPQVEIRQADPRVTVQQGAPSIDLQLRLAENPDQSEGVQIEDSASGETYATGEERQLPAEEAEVSATRSEPVIRMQRAQDGGPQVEIASAEPQVTYERAEPQVEMSRSGEVNVEWASSGEPTVTIRRDGEGDATTDEASNRQQSGEQQPQQAQSTSQGGQTDTQQPQEAQTAADTQQTGQVQSESETQQTEQVQSETATQQTEQVQVETQDSGNTGTQQPQQTQQAQGGTPNDLGVTVDGFETVGFGNMTADDLTGMPVYSARDGSIGDLDRVVVSEDQMAIEQFVIDVGGFLGLGAHPVALEPNQVQLMRGPRDEMRIYVDMTEEELSNLPRFDG